MTGDREKERKFLPILREKLDVSESLARLFLISFAKIQQELTLRESNENSQFTDPIVVNGICISDGKIVHFGQTQIYNVEDKLDSRNCFVHIGSHKLYEVRLKVNI